MLVEKLTGHGVRTLSSCLQKLLVFFGEKLEGSLTR